MKLAIFQAEIEFEDKGTNYRKAEKAIVNAKGMEADLIAFPEMSFTGFSMNVESTGEETLETIDFVMKLCRKYQIAIAFGWVKKLGNSEIGSAENHYTLISREGKILMDYVKCHPFSYAGEDKFFCSGNQICTCKIQDFVISAAICYDLRFPELFQIESKTAQMILVPANWPESRREHWRTLLRARAIENQCYIIGINCTGKMNGLSYSGDSCAIDPNGNVISELKEIEGMLLVELENHVDRIREQFPIKQDRREEFYYKQYAKKSKER